MSTSSSSQSASSHHRRTALVVPVFALKREGDLGIGDTSAVIELICWAAKYQVGMLQFLPITECGRDGSPYSAISSVALEPSLLDVTPAALTDLSEAEYDKVLSKLNLEGLSEGDIQFERVRQLKLDILWAAWEALAKRTKRSKRKQAYLAFCEAQKDWLEDYCLFRLLMDMEGGSELWDRWDDEIRSPEAARAKREKLLKKQPEQTEHSLGFYAFVQWIAFEQWAQVREIAEACNVWLMGDIPFGISYYSTDVFFQGEIFDRDWSGGAPPEKYFKDDPFVVKWGQNWGIPLYRWDVLKEGGYAWWKQRVRKTTEIMKAYRVDHVLGFYRIWSFPWRPERNQEIMELADHEIRLLTNGRMPGFSERPDDTQEQREQNCQAGHERLQALQQADEEAILVAEDLGTVPPYVRPDLASLGIPGTIIPHWTTNKETHQALLGADYPEIGFAIYATHDHETMAELWDRCQVERQAQGEDCAEAHTIRLLLQFMHWGEVEPSRRYDEEIQWALIKALLESRSCYAAFMITDLFGLRERFNIPGVINERNWRVRLPFTVKELEQDEQLKKQADKLKSLSEQANRTIKSN